MFVNTTNPDRNGETGEQIEYNLPEWMAISAFFAVAWYNVLELNISIFMTFKRRRGLYFWSLLVSSWGIVFHELGFLLKLFQVTTSNYLSCTLITIGWWPMVTGQAIVLYSRLHLVVKEQWILKAVKIMIIWNAVTLHIPTTVFTFGSSSPAWASFLTGFDYMERIQMTIFCTQEFIISGIYLWATRRLLRPIYRGRTRSVMMQLICINVVIILMDVAMLTEEYENYYDVEAPMKGMVYSIKLKLEFAVLTQLMRLANSGLDPANLRYDEEKAWGKEKKNTPLHRLARAIPRPGRARKNEESAGQTYDPTPPPRRSDLEFLQPQISNQMQSTRSFSMTGFGSIPDDPRMLGAVLHSCAETSANERNGSVSTIYNNPAAFFSGKRRRVRDPLDPLSTIDSPAISRESTTVRKIPTQFSNVDYQIPRGSKAEPDQIREDTTAGSPYSPTFNPPSPTQAAEPEPHSPTSRPLPPLPLSPTSQQARPTTLYSTTSTSTYRPTSPALRTSLTRTSSSHTTRHAPLSNRLSAFLKPLHLTLSGPSSPTSTSPPPLSPTEPSSKLHSDMVPDPDLLRPSRPSVTDWAPTPMQDLSISLHPSSPAAISDGDASSANSRTRLNPYEKAAHTLFARSKAIEATARGKEMDRMYEFDWEKGEKDQEKGNDEIGKVEEVEDVYQGRAGLGGGKGMGWVTSAL
ncbi:hypothetical protein MMC10_011384 [Thelotrema lepadinum]|nr:hypothetical protein [Thelotrema lepadinum]